METKETVPRQPDYITLIDNVIKNYFEKDNPITINGQIVPVIFLNAQRLSLWLRNVTRFTYGSGKNKGDIPTPSLIINREENIEMVSAFNQPYSNNSYARVYVQYDKKKADDTNKVPDNKYVQEYVWIKKPKPIKLTYTISCYSKYNLDVNEFYGEILDRLNASNLTIPNLPSGLDMRFTFDTKISQKDHRNASAERYIVSTFTMTAEGFLFNLNDIYRDTGIQEIKMEFKESEE